MDIQIYKNNFDLTDPFKEYLEDKFKSLEKYNNNITSFKVELNRSQKHNKGDVFTVEAHLQLPQHKTITVKESHIDARAAVDITQEKLARVLLKVKDKKITKLKRSPKFLKSLKFWDKSE